MGWNVLAFPMSSLLPFSLGVDTAWAELRATACARGVYTVPGSGAAAGTT